MLRGIANPLVAGLLAASLVGLAAADYPVGDLNGNCTMEWTDLQVLAGRWLDADCSAPECEADLDGVAGVNLGDLAFFAENWLESCRQDCVTIVGATTFRIRACFSQSKQIRSSGPTLRTDSIGRPLWIPHPGWVFNA